MGADKLARNEATDYGPALITECKPDMQGGKDFGSAKRR